MSMTKPTWETPVLTELNTSRDTHFGTGGSFSDSINFIDATTTTGPGWS